MGGVCVKGGSGNACSEGAVCGDERLGDGWRRGTVEGYTIPWGEEMAAGDVSMTRSTKSRYVGGQ